MLSTVAESLSWLNNSVWVSVCAGWLAVPHSFVFLSPDKFNPVQRARHGNRVALDVQRDHIITVCVVCVCVHAHTQCAAIPSDGLRLHKLSIGLYNTEHFVSSLGDISGRVVLGKRSVRCKVYEVCVPLNLQS